MGFFDRFRKKKAEPSPEQKVKDQKAHYHTALDSFHVRETDIACPECEKARKHVHLVETEGKMPECPECHYIHLKHR